MASARNIYKEVGSAVRVRRKKLRLSQEKLAEKADFTRNYIGQIERGEKKATLEAFTKVARALGVKVCDLLRDV